MDRREGWREQGQKVPSSEPSWSIISVTGTKLSQRKRDAGELLEEVEEGHGRAGEAVNTACPLDLC